jgi:hypothetical protein
LFFPNKSFKISEKSVETALNRLSPSKATGPEKVPVRILKETANIITPILTKNYQQSINTGQIPEDWKVSTLFSLILMSFIGLNGEFPLDGILVVFSVVNTDIN